MPISTFFGIETALRGLLAQQRALDVTFHNVANAQTPGYSRQEAVLSASTALTIPAGGIANGSGARLPTGVDVQQYRRIRDTFLDLQYRAQATALSEQQTRSATLGQVEDALAEPGDHGLNAELGRFWSAWDDFANAPEGPAARQALIESARNLAGTINELQRRMETVRRQAGEELAALTGPGGQADALARDLAATLNAIRDAEKTGAQPNDLYDRRDLILDRLAGLGQVSVTPSPAGGVDVTLGGVTIVDSDDATGTATVPAGTFPMTLGAAPGGRLGALQALAAPGGPIGQYQDDLSQFAQALASSVNGVYSATGSDFFDFGAGPSGLPELRLAGGVDAVTVRAGAGAAAANELARGIAALRGGDADARYARLVTRIGSDVADAGRREATARALAGNLEDRRQSVAGVSLDEEMSNLVRFQRGYQASARAMSTMDDLLDVLINRTGRVGL